MDYSLTTAIRTEADGHGASAASDADFDAMRAEFSIGAWVRPLLNCVEGAVVSRGDFTQATVGWSLNVSSNGTDGTAILYFTDAIYATADTTFDPARWNHIMWTFKRGVLRCFINAEESSYAIAPSVPSILQDSTDPVLLADTSRAHVAHVGLWTRALTRDEVVADFGGARPMGGNVAWWPCTDDFGNNVVDIFARHDAAANGGLYRAAARANASAPSTKVLFFGDDMVIGSANNQGSPDESTGFRRGVTWGLGIDERADVARAVGDVSAGRTFLEVCHSGIAGDQIADTDARIDEVCGAFTPTDVVLCVGANDIATYTSPGTKNALDTLIGHLRAKAYIARIFVVKIPPNATLGADVANYVADIDTLAATYTSGTPVHVIDCYTDFPTAGQSSGQWPNGYGYDIMAMRISAAIRNVWGTSRPVASQI